MSRVLDQATDVRTGEDLNLQALERFLQKPLNLSKPLAVKQFPCGYSNLTYLLRSGEKSFVLRRPPFGANIKTAHDMGREFRILSGLINGYGKVPQPLLYCEDESVLGAPFYVMERVVGVILRKQPPEDVDLPVDVMARLSKDFVDNLVEIHNVDVQAAGLGDLGRPKGYVKRQIEGWTRRYHRAKTDDVPEVDAVARWLFKHQPPESGAALVHNDYKYDNFLLDPDTFRIKAVLDWEMATVGDPLMDLGTSLGYWVDPNDPPELQSLRFCLTTLPGNLSRTQLVERYAEHSGRSVSHVLFYYVYGLFKIVVIIQQIYKRYVSGDSQDPRFAGLIEGVRALGRVAQLAIERQRIDGLG